jgi:hypothetical protein
MLDAFQSRRLRHTFASYHRSTRPDYHRFLSNISNPTSAFLIPFVFPKTWRIRRCVSFLHSQIPIVGESNHGESSESSHSMPGIECLGRDTMQRDCYFFELAVLLFSCQTMSWYFTPISTYDILKASNLTLPFIRSLSRIQVTECQTRPSRCQST